MYPVRLALGVLMAVLLPCATWAEPPSRTGSGGQLETKTTYYVNYWCSEWKNSERLLPAQAKQHAAILTTLGAETQVVTVGVTPPPGTRFPDPGLISEVQRVQFRLTSLKSHLMTDETERLLLVAFLQSAGMEVTITTNAPLKAIPAKAAAAVQLPKDSVWTGTITQQDRELPAELRLTNSGGTLKGELSFTFQPRDYQNRPLPLKTYKAQIEGEVKNGTVVLTATKALEGNVIIPTTYTLKFATAGSLKGQWEAQPLAGDIVLALKKP